MVGFDVDNYDNDITYGGAMTKTAKTGLIYFISTVLLLLNRVINGLYPLSDNWSGWLYSITSQILIMFALPMALYMLMIRKDGNVWKDTNIVPKKKLNPAIWGLSVALVPLFIFLTRCISVLWNGLLLPTIGFTAVSGVGTIYSEPSVLVMELITGALLPGFCEEFFNRGLLTLGIWDTKDEKMKAIIIGVIFGLFHMNIQQFGYAVFGGFVLGYLFVKTDNIWLGVILHVANNGWNTLCDYASQKELWLGAASDKVWDFMTSSVIILVAFTAIVALALSSVLAIIGRLADRSPERKKATEIVSENIFSERSSAEIIFGFVKEGETVSEEPKTVKAKFFEYGFLVAALVVMFAATVATLVWGLVR